MEEGYELDERGQFGDGQVEEEAGQGDQPVQEVAPQVVEGEAEETVHCTGPCTGSWSIGIPWRHFSRYTSTGSIP